MLQTLAVTISLSFVRLVTAEGALAPRPCWILPGVVLSHDPLPVLCGVSSRVPRTGATATIPQPLPMSGIKQCSIDDILFNFYIHNSTRYQPYREYFGPFVQLQQQQQTS